MSEAAIGVGPLAVGTTLIVGKNRDAILCELMIGVLNIICGL